MKQDKKTFLFAFWLCVVCGLILASSTAFLQPRQEANRELDRQRHILQALGELPSAASRSDILKQFRKLSVSNTKLPVYVWGKNEKFCIPVEGNGLWGPIRGFLALDSSLQYCTGISFYEHSETPGLGAELTSPSFCSQFIGKRLFDDQGTPLHFQVVKGGMEQLSNTEKASSVDALTGATLTSQGVERLVASALNRYRLVFAPFRKGEVK